MKKLLSLIIMKFRNNHTSKSFPNGKTTTLCFLFIFIFLLTKAQITYYVSPSGNNQWSGKNESALPGDGPLASLPAALEKVRADFMKTEGRDYRIVLMEGTYHLNEVIEINHHDRFRLSFEAYPGEKPVISAGRKITGWKEARVNGKTCWKVNLPEVKNGDFNFRQLFVNGQRANRPRLPKTGFYEVEDPLLGGSETTGDQLDNAARDRFIFREGDIKEWKNLQDVNVMVVHFWQENYLPIKEVNIANREVVFSARSFQPFLRSHPAHVCGNAWYYVDNVFEALDSPGEWYLDRPTGDLYYIPRKGEKINTTEIYAPVSTQIFRIEGNSDLNLFAGDVHFSGLEFRHSEIVWDAHYGTGNNPENSGPAMISFNSAHDCSISECVFSNLGEYAIELFGESERVYITGNNFSDLGAGAVKMRNCSEIYVTDNEIHSGGRVFHGAPAVIGNLIKHCRFLHNHISDFYFNGIKTTGARRSRREGKPGSYDNLIKNNYIHNIGQGWLSDMGGIAVSGLEPGMIISGNVVHDISSACYGANAVYMDDASQHIIVEHNLLYNADNAIINVKGVENTVRYNIMAFGGNSIIRLANPFLTETSTANIYKNVMLVNDAEVHRTRHQVPVFTPCYWSDLNVIWNIGRGPLTVAQPFHYGSPTFVAGFDEWIEKTGNDMNSVIMDPLFKDPLNGDFSLRPESIVHKLGIKIEAFDRVGPRPKEEWELTITRSAAIEVSTEGHIE